MDGDRSTDDMDLQEGLEWDVSIGPDLPGPQATVVLKLSKNGRTIRHRLDAQTATRLSNALIVQAERAQFKAAHSK
jgi:hypothetical protein